MLLFPWWSFLEEAEDGLGLSGAAPASCLAGACVLKISAAFLPSRCTSNITAPLPGSSNIHFSICQVLPRETLQHRVMLGSRSHVCCSCCLCLVVFPCSAPVFSPVSALLPLSAVICEPSEDPLNELILLSCFKIFTRFCISLVTRVGSVVSFSLKQS